MSIRLQLPPEVYISAKTSILGAGEFLSPSVVATMEGVHEIHGVERYQLVAPVSDVRALIAALDRCIKLYVKLEHPHCRGVDAFTREERLAGIVAARAWLQADLDDYVGPATAA